MGWNAKPRKRRWYRERSREIGRLAHWPARRQFELDPAKRFDAAADRIREVLCASGCSANAQRRISRASSIERLRWAARIRNRRFTPSSRLRMVMLPIARPTLAIIAVKLITAAAIFKHARAPLLLLLCNESAANLPGFGISRCATYERLQRNSGFVG
jgi:hypothetical protein